MIRICRLIMNWWRGPGSFDSTETERARKRLEDVHRDDARVERLDARMRRVQRENHLGPSISRALRARRP